MNGRDNGLGKPDMARIESVLLALTLFFYAFDGYIYYIVGLLYLSLPFLSLKLRFRKCRGIHAYILFFLLIFPITNWAFFNVPSLNNEEIRNFFGIVIIFWLILTIQKSPEKYKEVFRVLLICGIFESLYVVAEFFFPTVFLSLYGVFFPIRVAFVTSRMGEGYVAGFTNQVANTAYYIVIAIGITVYAGINTKRSGKILLFLLFFALILTGKRGHLLFCLIAMFATYFFSDQNHMKLRTWIKFLGVCAGGLIAVSVLYYSKTSIGIRIVETINAIIQGKDISSSRNTINLLSLNLIRENWLNGIGWGRFKYEYQNYFMGLSNGTWNQTFDAHNIYLQLLSETGIFGFAAFLILAIIALVQGRKLIRNSYQLSKKYQFVTKMSFYVQVFFLLYGFTGNPLYEFNEYGMYFLMIMLNSMIYRHYSDI